MQHKTIINRITSAAERVILSRVKNTSLFNEYYNRSDRKAEYKKQATTYQRKELKDWIAAVMAATDPENPRRGMLMRFYDSLMLDLHLGSCIDNRILPIQCAAYKLTDIKGVEDSEAHKLLERPWYIDLVKLFCMHTYEGTKLIELFELNEKGELKEVKEIPQANFIATKGIVIKEEYDDNGVSYKDGLYKDYYVQVGGDCNLGMLNQLASIVLAKKLGLGSWLSYIEKFGVPPIFAITERMDNGRRQELYEMLENFRMNHFAVLQGNEKIEVPNNYNVDAYNSFETLISKVANNEMSKRILGGSGISDEKSFVGSAEVQERLLKYRHQVDKLIFKYYFNEEVKPRLVKLSSVYKPLENLTFEFDETETLSLKDILNAVKELSAFYNFDIDELVKITGLPITSLKSALGDATPPAGEKKKPSANLRGGTPQSISTPIIYDATWDAAFERLANQIYNGEMKAEQLDKDLVLKNYSALSKEVETAWGKGYDESPVTRRLRENLLKFSGAKSYNLIKRVENLSTQNLSKEEFVRQARMAASLHNEAWLEVEKKFAANSASSARDFESFVKDSDIYPCLKNRTMADPEVRDSHAVNDGVIKPISEWKQIPPYDPGCRCWLEQTNEPPTTHQKMQNLDEKWANNPVLSGKIFVGNHSYFASVPKEVSRMVKENTERMKEYVPFGRIVKVGEKSVFVNDFADLSDVHQNMEAAKLLAKELGENIYIRPHIDSISGYKNPELGIGVPNAKADLKTYEPMVKNKPVLLQEFVRHGIEKANKQKAATAILDISKYVHEDYKDILQRKLIGELKGINRNINAVVVIRGKSVARISRKQVNSKNFKDFLKGI